MQQESTEPSNRPLKYENIEFQYKNALNENCPKSTLLSKNIVISGKRTSIRLEPEMWQSLKDIARRERCTVNDVCTLVSMCKKDLSSLTASIRVFLMLYYKAASTEEGHMKAGHGNIYNMKERIKQMQVLKAAKAGISR